jgi:hypothetical protein
MSDTAAEMLYLYLLGIVIILILVVGTWKASTAGGTKRTRTRRRDRQNLESAPSSHHRDQGHSDEPADHTRPAGG